MTHEEREAVADVAEICRLIRLKREEAPAPVSRWGRTDGSYEEWARKIRDETPYIDNPLAPAKPYEIEYYEGPSGTYKRGSGTL